VVYADSSEAPAQYFVQHRFGFAQIFGSTRPEFEQELERFLLRDKGFDGSKVRVYAPEPPAFLRENPACDGMRVHRQRFVLERGVREQLVRARSPALPEDAEAVYASPENIDAIGEAFGVVTRFWTTSQDFVSRARAAAVSRRGRLASVCYAAAVSDGRAEIDVLTLPEFRGMGIGKATVSIFLRRCLEESLEPLWDCFTNNAGSMALSRAAGFVPLFPPYPFYTINK
jgi:RimJ/RimL family protein N-acetyltransferase